MGGEEMEELISVIIPVYNRKDKLEKSVESVLKQSWKNLEIIAVDDGSTDGTGELLQRLEAEIPVLKAVLLPQNGGAANARNAGVKEASGEWLAFQDSDDYWYPDKLEKQMAYHAAHPEYPLIYSAFRVQSEKQQGKYPRDDMSGLEGDIYPQLLVRNTIGSPTILVKKECFWEAGGFDPSYRNIEDWDFVIRFSRKYPIGYVNEVLVDADYYQGERISALHGNYYLGRLRMIVSCREDMQKLGIFDRVLLEVFETAAAEGCLEQVKQLFRTLMGMT